MDVRPGVIKNYAQRHVISDNYCFAVYGISIIDQNGDIITNYAQRADDIKYFDSVTDFQNYVNKLKQKLHVVKIHYVTSFPVGNLHGEK